MEHDPEYCITRWDGDLLLEIPTRGQSSIWLRDKEKSLIATAPSNKSYIP